nr:hypothetical protein [Actinomycetota bacterium]
IAGFVTALEGAVAILPSIAGGCDSSAEGTRSFTRCHTRGMPDILVDFSPSRPDDDETAEVAAELVAAVRDLGYDAGTETERFEFRGAGLTWTLALRWAGDHAADVAALGGFLVLLGDRVLAIFQRHRRPPPRHLQLYGPDGETVIARVELPGEDEESP